MKTEIKNGINVVHAKSPKAWRNWLEKNGDKEKSIWLIIYRKASGVSSVTYEEAVEEALCFGWIDSKPNKRDEKSRYQYFAKRNPKSKWSLINKKRVERLINDGRMHKSGLTAVEIAKRNGTWMALEEIDRMIVPDDLREKLGRRKEALKNFMAFPNSSKKIILEWIANAKKVETRNKRIEETVTLAAKNMRANHYRQ